MTRMENDEAKFKRYLLGELYWELEQHPHISSPFSTVERESVEVLAFRGYDDLRVRVSGVTYDAHLSWKKTAPPVITRVENTNAA
jgi:hypothetical protein